MEAGVRKASREETAGDFAPALVSGYGDLAPVFDLIFDFRSGKTAERVPASVVLSNRGCNRNGDAVLRDLRLGEKAGAESCCGRSAAVAGEMSASQRCSDGGWRKERAGHELSRPIAGTGHNRGRQPGSKISTMTIRPPQQGQVFHSSSA